MPIAKNRPGRPPEAERARRRSAALDAALAELVAGSYESLTMSAVARRAGSSKESLYAWFGSKQGMVAALIERQAEGTNAAVRSALAADDADHRATLTAIARGLLRLLLGEASLALNRAAMSSPVLAQTLLRHGRHTTGPLVEEYLAALPLPTGGRVADPEEAFRLFYGLVVEDAQIRALLGEAGPDDTELARRAAVAVDRFLMLASSEATGGGRP